jgi:multidrug efflux system membrane fusion protein
MKIDLGSVPARRPVWRLLALGVIVIAAALLSFLVLQRRATVDDATIDADVVHIAPEVGGQIVDLAVREDAAVRRGEVLFRIDAQPYALRLRQARAQLEVAQAALDARGRGVAGARANAAIAQEQIARAQDNYGLSARTSERLAPLAAKGYVAQEQLDQARVAERDATTSLSQARLQAAAARHAVGDTAAEQAEVDAAQAAVALAQRQLEATTVRAPHDGRVSGLNVASGETVVPAQALFTLVDTEQWWAVANVRETELQGVAAGDCATVYSMLDSSRPMHGVVDGIGWGVLRDDAIDLPRSVPYVQASLNWVRVAQRFPVRVRIDDPRPDLLRLGASASVELHHGPACR